MKTINIKGKAYVQVNDRVKEFRNIANIAGYAIETRIEQLTDDVCVMCAMIKNAEGRILSTGWAREVRNDATSMVNKTSYVENCETSAVGRALGFFGIGVDTAICSAEELYYAQQAAEAAQNTPKIPSNRITPTPQENAADAKKPVELTERESKEYYEAVRQMRAAADVNALYRIFGQFKDARFQDLLLAEGREIKKQKGWQ